MNLSKRRRKSKKRNKNHDDARKPVGQIGKATRGNSDLCVLLKREQGRFYGSPSCSRFWRFESSAGFNLFHKLTIIMSEEVGEKRLGVDIPEEMWFKLNRYIPWGNKKDIYRALTRQLLQTLEESDDPHMVLAMILSDEVTVKDIADIDETQ